MNLSKQPLAGIPIVEVVDETGRVLYEGYYWSYPEYQGYPVIANGETPENIPLVEGIMTYDAGDWGLTNTPRFFKITPPHMIRLKKTGKGEK